MMMCLRMSKRLATSCDVGREFRVENMLKVRVSRRTAMAGPKSVRLGEHGWRLEAGVAGVSWQKGIVPRKRRKQLWPGWGKGIWDLGFSSIRVRGYWGGYLLLAGETG